MNRIVIISMACFLFLIIIEFNAFIPASAASDISYNTPNTNSYKIITGTICSDKTNQAALDITGTKELPDKIPRCYTPPDIGRALSNLVGTKDSDIIYGRDGLDVLQGREGDDILDGGNHDDVFFGDDGNDDLFGSFGDDQMFGGNGDDLLDGSFGNDYILGGNGNDEIYGGQGSDILKGGLGPDLFDCGDNIDIVLDYNTLEGDILSGNCENSKTRH